MIHFQHFNFNVLDLDKSQTFYKNALDLEVVREYVPEDGSFELVYLGDGKTSFQLELTWLRDRTEPYNLGECEFHLAFVTTTTRGSTPGTRRWDASATRTPTWAFTLSPTPTGTGSRSSPKSNQKNIIGPVAR